MTARKKKMQEYVEEGYSYMEALQLDEYEDIEELEEIVCATCEADEKITSRRK